jgi:hypothetical protein
MTADTAILRLSPRPRSGRSPQSDGSLRDLQAPTLRASAAFLHAVGAPRAGFFIPADRVAFRDCAVRVGTGAKRGTAWAPSTWAILTPTKAFDGKPRIARSAIVDVP